MITIICGTNRPASYTSKVAAFYSSRLQNKNVEHRLFSMEDMPGDLIVNSMYDEKNEDMRKIENEVLIPATKYIILIPEYNGSFPGVLKAFMDASDIKKCWHNKQACLVGVASGRAGNLRGMEHMTNILNHMKINVLHLKVPVSGVTSLMDDHDNITSEETIRLIDEQIDLLLDF